MSDLYNRKIQSIVIHHPGDGQSPEVSITKRWNPYNYQFPEYDFGVESDGTVQTGRPLNYQGAHCISDKQPYISRGDQWFNQNSIGIAVAGDFTKYQMSKVQLLGLIGLVQRLMKQYNIPISEVFMHKHVTYTDCPGNWNYEEFYSLVKGNVISTVFSLTQSASDKPVLRQGDNNNFVGELQNLLNKHNYNLLVDNDFGQKTSNALRDFQIKNGLVSDSIAGFNTWSKLLQNDVVVTPIVQPQVVVKPKIIIPTSVLWKGNKNNNYKDTVLLQKTLNKFSNYGLSEDGDFGQLTLNAVLDFQRKMHLEVDGVVGSQSWNILLN